MTDKIIDEGLQPADKPRRGRTKKDDKPKRGRAKKNKNCSDSDIENTKINLSKLRGNNNV